MLEGSLDDDSCVFLFAIRETGPDGGKVGRGVDLGEVAQVVVDLRPPFVDGFVAAAVFCRLSLLLGLRLELSRDLADAVSEDFCLPADDGSVVERGEVSEHDAASVFAEGASGHSLEARETS